MTRLSRLTGLLAALLTGVPLALACSGVRAQDEPVYKDAGATVAARVQDLLGRMTEDEKLGMLAGTGSATMAIPRLGVPGMEMADAGEGVRGSGGGMLGPATQFPAGVAMASSWDLGLIGKVGRAIGDEARNKGVGAQVLLGPDVNIQRSPLGGRDGEQFTEDPYLNSELAVAYIAGLQGSGDAACVKHFACNNEEVDRHTVDVKVGERALREIYLPAFKASVQQAHVWTIMPSYNLVNGFHSTANRYLLTDVARGDWGFDGAMISDWGAVHETARVVNAGNDIEMPDAEFLTVPKLKAALASGAIRQSQVDLAVTHLLTTIVRVGLLDGPVTPDHSKVNTPEHQKLAYRAACEGMVLLKNKGSLLPLDAKRIKSIAVIGPAAGPEMQFAAQGSPEVEGPYEIAPVDGIRKRAGNGVKIDYVASSRIGAVIPASAFRVNDTSRHTGLRASYFNTEKLSGSSQVNQIDPNVNFDWKKGPAPGIGHEYFSARWTGQLIAPETGRYLLSMSGDDGYRLFVGGRRIIDHWEDDALNTTSASIDLVKGRAYPIRAEYYQGTEDAVVRLNWVKPSDRTFDREVAAARKSDVAVVLVNTGFEEGEGEDRPSMDLPNGQGELIARVAAANRNTVVVLNNGTPVTTARWLGRVPAALEAWLPGQEGGHALASVLFGDVNPSGKLPTTFGARRQDYSDYGNFPGDKQGVVHYAEGIYVGYRHFDKAKIAPVFPFGYGLSYTTFKYGAVRLSSASLTPGGTISVSVPVTNTGRRTGVEVVELYLRDLQPKEDRAVRELKGFGRVELLPGQTRAVTLPITAQDLAYFDVAGREWKADAGRYAAEVGSSSREIRGRAEFGLAGEYVNQKL